MERRHDEVPRLQPGQGPLRQRSHVLSLFPQRCVPQDTGFSSLFLKVLMQMLQWLDGPGMEAGPLQAQLKLFATQYSARRRISDGEGGIGTGRRTCAWGLSSCWSAGVTALDWRPRGGGHVVWGQGFGEVPREESMCGNRGEWAFWGLSGKARLTGVRGEARTRPTGHTDVSLQCGVGSCTWQRPWHSVGTWRWSAPVSGPSSPPSGLGRSVAWSLNLSAKVRGAWACENPNPATPQRGPTQAPWASPCGSPSPRPGSAEGSWTWC